jgi:hypothetical protein
LRAVLLVTFVALVALFGSS